MAEPLESLTARQRALLQEWGQQLDAAPGWSGSLPVALLERCWLRLRRIPVEQLARVLPPDASAEAPELVRYRHWIAAGEPAWAAQLRCWQDFGPQACQQAQRQFWRQQERGNHAWTLAAYLDLLRQYRQAVESAGPRRLPLLVLARSGQREDHQLHWLTPQGRPMRHTCA